MKKLLQGVLSLAIVAMVATPQINAAGDTNYTIQVKNKYYDKESQNANRKGLAYTNDKPEYTNSMWMLVDGKHSYTTPFTANYYDPYNRTTTNSKTCYVKQFAVSKGVVYWINPSEDVIHYWNTVDNTSGAIAPTGTYNGVSYPFKGSDTGYGSITHDWQGNLVHAWNGYGGSSNNINTPTRGYAVYKAPDTYGTVINTAPVLSDMPTCATSHARRSAAGAAWTSSTTANPNILGDENVYNGSTTMTNLNTYGLNQGGATGGTDIAVDFISASGNLFDNVGWVNSSTYQAGYWGGQVWHTYGHIVTGNMFADGAYSNWFMNYLVTTSAGTAQIPNGSFGDGLLTYSREFFFQEAGGKDSGSNWNQYYYSSPNRGLYQTTGDGKISHQPTIIYPRIHPSYATSYYGSDPTLAPDIQRLKGYRIFANILWKGANIGTRNGSIEVNVEGNTAKTGESRIGYGYAYGMTENTNPIAGAMNGWLEYEKVNENVLALYSYCPGQGFSKYYVTAVRSNNKVSNVSISEIKSINNLTPQAKITWTAQAYDRETLHRYHIYYKAYNKSTGAVEGESGVTVDDATWRLATVDANGNPQPVDIGSATTGQFIHNTPVGVDANGKKYQITYKYLIVPVYDDSDHMGEEVETEFTPTIPYATIKGNLYQVTDNGGPNGETRYGFSVRLDPYFDADAVGATSVTRFVITSAGGYDGWYALKEATSVTLADGTPLTFVENVSFTQIGGNSPTEVNQYALDIPVTVGTDGKLPSIIWHNVDPSKTFKVGLHADYTNYTDIGAEDPGSVTLTVPDATLSMTEATIRPLDGDYSAYQRNNILPLGAQRKVGSDEVTNPVTLSNANTFGTKGSAINPLLVTDEVLENWNIQYKYNIFKNGEYLAAYDIDASNTAQGAALYSNMNNVTVDVVGLPIEKTAWDTHTALKLTDAQKASNENITKQGYSTTTGNNSYSAHIDVTFTRKEQSIVTNADVSYTNGGELDASSPISFGAGISDGKIFPDLGVDFGTTLALFKRESTHFYYNSAEDEGYYPVYYDAAAQWTWPEYSDDLNRYVGFHAVTQFDCVGHYVLDENGNRVEDRWIPYYAPSVLSDYYVEQTNITLAKDGNANPTGDPLSLSGIGYDGTANTDWSALAAQECTLPMQIHYVWGGERELTNSEEDRTSMKFKVLMTADYPVIESNYGATIVLGPNAVTRNSDSYYTLAAECEAGHATMNMISSYNNSAPWADYVTNVTGVEGILVNACGGVNLYPNPVGSTFTLETPMEMNEVKIFTMDGQLVKVITGIDASKATINVEELPQGMYIVNTLGVAKMMIKM